jgi:hypothetical protein
MASYRAIGAISNALIKLLEENPPPEEMHGAEFKLYHPSDFEHPMTEGFSLLLYRVTVNPTLRNLPPRRTADGRQFKPSLPVDLYYLLTAWAAEPDRQQRLLGWAMRFFEDRSIIPANIVNHYLGEPERTTFSPQEALEVVSDALSITDQLNLWDKLKPKMQTSVSYVVRMVLLDALQEDVTGPAVQTRVFNAGAGATQ